MALRDGISFLSLLYGHYDSASDVLTYPMQMNIPPIDATNVCVSSPQAILADFESPDDLWEGDKDDDNIGDDESEGDFDKEFHTADKCHEYHKV